MTVMSGCFCVKADVIPLPKDLPSIEALISAHKALSKMEDQGIKEIGAITTTQTFTDKATKAYNQTRTILNKRLSDGVSYVQLATQVTNVTMKLERLIENYKDFTTTTFQYTVKKPYVLVYYTRANLQLKKEIKHLTEMVAGLAAANFNILKATMEEKFQLLSRIEISIAAINRIIDHNDLVCRTLLRNGLKIYHVQDILNDRTFELTTQKLIARWDKEQGVKY